MLSRCAIQAECGNIQNSGANNIPIFFFFSNLATLKALLQDAGLKGLCQLIQSSVAFDKDLRVELPANKFFIITWLLTIGHSLDVYAQL